jgi:hypothetical protein
MRTFFKRRLLLKNFNAIMFFSSGFQTLSAQAMPTKMALASPGTF